MVNRIIIKNQTQLINMHPDIAHVCCVLEPGSTKYARPLVQVVFFVKNETGAQRATEAKWTTFQTDNNIPQVERAFVGLKDFHTFTRRETGKLHISLPVFKNATYMKLATESRDPDQTEFGVDCTLIDGDRRMNNFPFFVIGIKEPQLGMPITVYNSQSIICCTSYSFSFKGRIQKDCFCLDLEHQQDEYLGALVIQEASVGSAVTQVYLVGVVTRFMLPGKLICCRISRVQQVLGLDDNFWLYNTKAPRSLFSALDELAIRSISEIDLLSLTHLIEITRPVVIVLPQEFILTLPSRDQPKKLVVFYSNDEMSGHCRLKDLYIKEKAIELRWLSQEVSRWVTGPVGGLVLKGHKSYLLTHSLCLKDVDGVYDGSRKISNTYEAIYHHACIAPVTTHGRDCTIEVKGKKHCVITEIVSPKLNKRSMPVFIVSPEGIVFGRLTPAFFYNSKERHFEEGLTFESNLGQPRLHTLGCLVFAVDDEKRKRGEVGVVGFVDDVLSDRVIRVLAMTDIQQHLQFSRFQTPEDAPFIDEPSDSKIPAVHLSEAISPEVSPAESENVILETDYLALVKENPKTDLQYKFQKDWDLLAAAAAQKKKELTQMLKKLDEIKGILAAPPDEKAMTNIEKTSQEPLNHFPVTKERPILDLSSLADELVLTGVDINFPVIITLPGKPPRTIKRTIQLHLSRFSSCIKQFVDLRSALLAKLWDSFDKTNLSQFKPTLLGLGMVVTHNNKNFVLSSRAEIWWQTETEPCIYVGSDRIVLSAMRVEIRAWTKEEVCLFLKTLPLECDYSAIIKKHEIDGHLLFTLPSRTESFAQELKLTEADCNVIKTALVAYTTQQWVASSLQK